MVHHLVTATKVAGLTYRLASSLTLLGLLGYGIIEFIRHERTKR
jgi:hypothetical protein